MDAIAKSTNESEGEMKAIELANELDKLWDKSFRNPMVSKSANMLRQQAKEIEILVEDVKNKNINIEYLKEKLIASIDDIKTLKADLEVKKASER